MAAMRGRTHKSRREMRTLVVFALIFFLFAAAIVFVRNRNSETLKPPPLTPEMQDLIASPENAYQMLYASLEFLPESKPLEKEYPVPGNPTKTAFYETEADSIARELDLWAPDESPEVAAYIAQLRPGIDKAREATSAKYFIFPEQEERVAWGLGASWLSHMRVSYRHAWEIRAARQEALDLLFDAIRLSRVVRQDGDFSYVYSMQFEEQDAWQYLIAYLAETDDSAILAYTVEKMMELNEPPPLAYDRILRAEWRAGYARLERIRKNGRFQGIETLSNIRIMRSQRQALEGIIEQGEVWQQMLSFPYPPFEKEVARLHEEVLDNPNGNYTNAAFSLFHCKYEETCCVTLQRQILLLMLLELHRRDKGEYPEALVEAVADHLETVPEDPFTGNPFEYNPDTPERLLVSPGPKIHPDSLQHLSATDRLEIANGVRIQKDR